MPVTTAIGQIAETEEEVGEDEHAADLTSLMDAQTKVSVNEKSVWERCRAAKDNKGVWRSVKGQFVATLSLLTVLIHDTHWVEHVCRGGDSKEGAECVVVTISDSHSRQNTKGLYSEHNAIPLPDGPFSHLIMDYIDITPKVVGKYRCVGCGRWI